MRRILNLFSLLLFILISVPARTGYGAGIAPELVLEKEYFLDEIILVNKMASNLNMVFFISSKGIELDELYVQGELFGGELTLGRKYQRSGPGYFSQLLLSDQGTPLTMISHEGKFIMKDKDEEYFLENDYIMLWAYLDEGVNKQFFYHRISNDTLIKGLEIGVAESVIASRQIHPAYYLPVPFLPYYLTSYIIGQDSIYNDNEDKYIGFDFTYSFANGAEIYGELLVDEFPQTKADNNPDKRAHLLGFYLPCGEDAFRLEYSNVFNYVYLHRFPWNSYTYNGKYLGHWLGHDGDVLRLEWEREEGIRAGFSYLRKGIGDMKTDFGPDHKEKKFLSSITRKELSLHLGYDKVINDRTVLEINSRLGKAYLTDKGEEDIVELNLVFRVRL